MEGVLPSKERTLGTEAMATMMNRDFLLAEPGGATVPYRPSLQAAGDILL